MNETWNLKLAKARARHGLESPGYPSQGKSSGLGSKTQVQVVDGSTGHGNAVTTKRFGLVFLGRPDKRGPWNSKASPSHHWHILCGTREVWCA